MALVFLSFVRNPEHTEIKMKLHEKLKLIRTNLKCTQDQMAAKLGLGSPARRARISEWERGSYEPKRELLLKYAKLGEVEIEKLIDDRESIEFK